MCQLLRRIVAAGLLMGGLTGCATVPGSVLGYSGSANASVMPAMHWTFTDSDLNTNTPVIFANEGFQPLTGEHSAERSQIVQTTEMGIPL